MKKKSKRTLTPRLRFPEFRNVGKWNEQKIGEIVALEYGSPLPEKDRKGGRFPVIGSNGIVGYHDEAIVDGPAIVVGRKGSAGQVNWIESDCYPIDTTFFVKNLNPESCPIAFLWRLFERSNLERLGDAGAVPGLNRNEVYSLKTHIPAPPEQQKIAECLGSLDGLIAAEGRKLAALRDHKRGLMQQLFPGTPTSSSAVGESAGGDAGAPSQPRLRFPEFRDKGGWVSKKLKKVAPLQRGFDLPASEIREGQVPIVYSNGIRGKHATGMATGPGLVTGRSGTIGKLHYIESGDYWPHNTALWVTDFCGNLPKFVYYLYDAIGLERFSSGSGVPTLNRNDVHAFLASVPRKIQEQHRIADCLTALDTRITAQAAKIETLKRHKRGLMQQLFPAPEEV